MNLKYFFVYTMLAVLLVANPSTAAAAPPSTKELYSRIDNYIKSEMDDACIPSLSIGLLYHNKVVYMQGYSSHYAGSTEVTPQTPFILGSISKSITALALMQLSQKRLVNVDEQAEKYIRWLPAILGKYSKNITIKSLMNHTSGLRKITDNYILDYISARQEYKTSGSISNSEGVRKLQQALPSVNSGTYEYANINYLIISDIIESVTGIPYAQYIKQNIYEPLDMKNSYVSLDDAEKGGLAACYRPLLGFPCQAKPNTVAYDETMSMGYLVSSAEDMTHYLQMYGNIGLYSDTEVASPESIKEMLTPSADINNGGIQYGYGWFIDNKNQWYYHFGETYDFHTLQYMQKDGWSMIILLNRVQVDIPSFTGIGTHLMSGVVDILNGKEPAKSGFFTISNFFGIIKALSLILICLAIWTVIMLVRTARNKHAVKPKGLKTVVGIVLLNLLLPLSIFTGFQFIAHASWYSIINALPDFFWLLLGCAAISIIGGISRLAILFVQRKRVSNELREDLL